MFTHICNNDLRGQTESQISGNIPLHKIELAKI